MDPWVVTVAAAATLAVAAGVGYALLTRPPLLARIAATRRRVIAGVERWFAVQPCFRCYEFEMRLLGISPNGRSVHYQCRHCKKKMHAPAGTPDAAGVLEQYQFLAELVERYREQGYAEPPADELEDVLFVTPAAPLPYEQTTRTPIPEAVRGEVWRRDGGQCAKCGSKRNLQFDHIIPVSRGGANSVANLQLLCLPCNAAKGDQV